MAGGRIVGPGTAAISRSRRCAGISEEDDKLTAAAASSIA